MLDLGQGTNNPKREELPRVKHCEAGTGGRANIISRISSGTGALGVSAAHTTLSDPGKAGGVCHGPLPQKDF